MYTIVFETEGAATPPVVVHGVAPRQSLLESALEHGIPLPHQCGGVCACSTCHIYLTQGADLVEAPHAREKGFIARAEHPRQDSRLACQCVLLKGQGLLRLTLPGRST